MLHCHRRHNVSLSHCLGDLTDCGVDKRPSVALACLARLIGSDITNNAIHST